MKFEYTSLQDIVVCKTVHGHVIWRRSSRYHQCLWLPNIWSHEFWIYTWNWKGLVGLAAGNQSSICPAADTRWDLFLNGAGPRISMTVLCVAIVIRAEERRQCCWLWCLFFWMQWVGWICLIKMKICFYQQMLDWKETKHELHTSLWCKYSVTKNDDDDWLHSQPDI